MSGLTLVLGGVRSGKSAFAEQLAAAAGPRVLYVATSIASDAEMEERVRRHRARRPATWGLIEEPLDIIRALDCAEIYDAILLESVSGWLANLLLRRLMSGDSSEANDTGGRKFVGEDSMSSPAESGDESELRRLLEQEAMAGIDALIDRQQTRRLRLIAVSDETGLSLVPPNPAGRLFQDLLGSVNQALAAAAERVYLVVAGLPLQLKGTPAPAAAPPDADDPHRR